jgi:hypothetical protein
MNKKKDIKITKKNWPAFVLGILLLLWVFGYFDGNEKEDYALCVDWCVADMHECRAMNMQNRVFIDGDYWIQESYPEECHWDLNDCIDECKLD